MDRPKGCARADGAAWWPGGQVESSVADRLAVTVCALTAGCASSYVQTVVQVHWLLLEWVKVMKLFSLVLQSL